MSHKKELLEKAKALSPVIWVGKNGITQGVIDEVTKLVKKKRLIKVKFLKSFIETTDKKLAAKMLASKTDSKIVMLTGFVVVLERLPGNDKKYNLNKN
jgi:RNA-binding protein